MSVEPPRGAQAPPDAGNVGASERAVDRVTLLADVAEVVSRSHDLDETLNNVVDLVAKRLDADVCSLYLTGEGMRKLVLSATVGLNKQAVGRVTLRFGEGLVGLAAETRAPIATERASSHPNFKYFPETGEERYEGLMAVPLFMRGVAIGVLVVQTRMPRHFDADDISLLQTCAQLIAPVVMNARLMSLVDESDEERAASMRELARLGIRVTGQTPARAERNLEFRGHPAAQGIAIGPLYRLEEPIDLDSVDYRPSADPAAEEADLLRALADSRRELDGVRDTVAERFGPDFAAVFNTHLQILEDKGFVSRLTDEVRARGNALVALRTVLDAYRKTFDRIEDPYFRDRVTDVEEVGRRVVYHLLDVRHQTVPMPDGAIVVAENIYPGDFVHLDLARVGALVSEHGGPTSHAVIFARTLEIPAVTGVARIFEAAQSGELAIVDGGDGRVFFAPDAALVAEYERARRRHAVTVEHLDAFRDMSGQTRDGRSIRLTANAGLMSDLRLIERHGADGIGLFRTEMLAFAHRGFPEEEEQEQLYERVARWLAPRPVTIRTLDLGGEKGIPTIDTGHEDNPQLGCRSIRLSFEHEGTFRAQLRAILRASAAGNVRLLLPMISSLGELRRAKELIEQSKSQLARAGVPFDPKLPVGIMIEVPAAAIGSARLAEECDFFSIGTNDLTQYTLAVDRGNERVAHLFDPLHPAVLSLIDRSVRAATRAGIPVSVCGEMASNPLAIPILIGLGISELSAAPSAVPVMKQIVHALDSGLAEEDARRALEAATAQEVARIGAERIRERGLLSHPDIGPWLDRIVDGRPA
jgi:phosphotransferase system enzyme I (PtsP)